MARRFNWSSRHRDPNETKNGDPRPDKVHRKHSDAVIESGCGKSISWRSMLPVKPEIVAVLGTVETMKAKQIKHLSEKRFHNEVEVHEELNLEILRQGISIIEDNVNEE